MVDREDKFLIKGVLCCVLLLSLIANVWLILENRVPPSPQGSNVTVPYDPRYEVATVEPTGSMEPVMNGKSHLLLEKAPVGIGDIAVYYKTSQEDIVGHRIIGEKGDNWIFKGDNWWATEIVPKSKVLWRVKGIIY